MLELFLRLTSSSSASSPPLPPVFVGLVPDTFPGPLTCSTSCHQHHTPLPRLPGAYVCAYVLSVFLQEERENERREGVYAFSPSLSIINVSQVRKIASCSIPLSSSPPLAFCSLHHSVFVPPPWWFGRAHPLRFTGSRHGAQGDARSQELLILDGAKQTVHAAAALRGVGSSPGASWIRSTRTWASRSL